MNNRKIIVGLGNPGAEYTNTRHNAGLMLVEFIKDQFRDLTTSQLPHSTLYKRPNMLLAVTKTFMNESGLAVKELLKWTDAHVEEEFILAHDDLDILLGRFKYQFGKSPRIHNGVISVEQALGTTHFHRFRIGIENRKSRALSGKSYVLRKFDKDELQQMNDTFADLYRMHLSD
ncbi:MAG: aminoacyl-tRNA hydrolase [Candidatus Dojkabacteria bacterium]|nr:aminoacyl-tRNA hydrolase [Candidatus Dojkabacteria bacterium]